MAIFTNPIWGMCPLRYVPPSSKGACGFRAILHDEGLRGLYHGTFLALSGFSNDTLQFMGYEKDKGCAFERQRRRVARLGSAWKTDDEKLVHLCVPRTRPSVDLFEKLYMVYMVMSGASKL